MKKKSSTKNLPAAPVFEELEPRVLFSAGVEGFIAGDVNANGATEFVVDDNLQLLRAANSQQSNKTGAEQSALELVFIDNDTPDREQLLDDLLRADARGERRFEIIELTSDRDGVTQISETLRQYSGVDAIHIISHGNDGSVSLGNSTLSSSNVADYAKIIGGWGVALNADADILIYGCNLAASDAGQILIDHLSTLTSADIAASTDLTGNVSLGGDWVLEHHQGQVDTQIAFSVALQQQWQGTLATMVVDTTSDLADGDTTSLVTFGATNTDGLVSLREAIELANNTAGTDVLSFNISGSGPHTIQPGSALPDITDTVIIDGTTEPDFAGTPIIELDGSSTGAGVDGIRLVAGSDGSTIRGLVINQFGQDGIDITSDNHTIVGNYIGTDATGLLAFGNGNSGVNFDGGINALIGGTTAADRNVISGNLDDGVEIDGGSGHRVQGNYIGVGADGVTSVGNGSVGVKSSVSNVTIGGDAPGAGNMIANHLAPTAVGVWVTGGATGVTILGNSIYNNNALGIELGAPFGANPNDIGDVDTGNNNLQNFPVITSSITDGAGNLTIDGTLNTDGLNQDYRIEFFASTTADTSTTPSHGEAERYLGFVNVTTDGSGDAAFSTVLSVTVAAGEFITATATVDLGGGNYSDTSEFAKDAVAINSAGASLVVDTTSDTSDGDTTSISTLLADKGADGAISLREAIQAANNTPNGALPDEIHFAIALNDAQHFYYQDDLAPGLSTVTVTTLADASITDFDPDYPAAPFSWYSIALTADLPTVTDAVVIDGTTQSGFVSAPVIELDGSSLAAGTGFQLSSGASTLRGFTINGFPGNGVIVDSDNNLIAGNYIGTDASGTIDAGNGNKGVRIYGANNTVGGASAADRNVISGNDDSGVTISGPGATGNIVLGNYIGVDVTGTAALGNTASGVTVSEANNTIGGANAGEGNVISGNTQRGIQLWSSAATNNTIRGNYIGTNAAGTAAIGNGDDGVKIEGGANNNTIGGDSTAGEGNLISGNGNDGIEILRAGSDNNRIYGNYIGIDVTGNIDLGNGRNGVVIYDDAQNNEVGGTGTGQGNVISGNDNDAVVISGNLKNLTTGNTVVANMIGTNVAGNGAIGNSNEGVELSAGATGNTVGGVTAAHRNIISGNSQGIRITGASTTGNTVIGNYIGTDVTGLVDLGNSDDGIEIDTGASGNTIGGTTVAERNVISGNNDDGFSSNSNSNVVQGNYIGVGADGTTSVGNSSDGVELWSASSSNRIGGTLPGQANLIRHSGGDGISMSGTGSGNQLLGNSISANGGLGVDLGDDGVTANDIGYPHDTDSGANGLQNYPVLSSATTNAVDTITVFGNLNSTPSTTFRIEFFAGTNADASGFGEGQRYLGFTTVTTNGSGDTSFGVPLTATVASGEFITATATVDLGGGTYGDTSEFAAVQTASLAPVITLPSGAVNYTENDPPVIVDAAATVSDADSANFDGGELTVSFSTGGIGSDRLELRHQGNGLAEIGISGATVSYSGTQIGTFRDVDDTLVVTFNSNADALAVEAVLRSVTYRNVSDNPGATPRDLRFGLTDGDGGVSLAAFITVNVTAMNDLPVAQNDPDDASATVASYIPLSYWRLGEASGTTAADLGSVANNGTYNGGVTLGESGPLAADTDTAVRFDGVDDYIEMAHDPAYLVDEGSVQLWFNVDAITGNYQALFSKDSSGVDNGGHLTIQLTPTGELEVRMQHASVGSNNGHLAVSPSPVAAGQWHHVALSFGSAGMQLYVDGVLVATDAYTGGLGTSAGGSGNDEPIAIGAATIFSGDGVVTPLDRFFAGSIDEVAIFGAPLDQAAVKNLYAAGLQDYAVVEDSGALNVTANNGVLADDFDPDGDPITAVLVSGPGNAQSFTLNADGSFDYTPNADFSGTDSFTYHVNDGTGDSLPATVTITVTGVNDRPTWSNGSGARDYTENDTGLFIQPVINIQDIDSPDFAGGTLTVHIALGGTSNDVFQIAPGGNVTLSGSDVLVSGTIVGTFSGGATGTDLVISWNANSSPAAAQEVARRITYSNTSDNPTTTTRAINFVLTDGDGGTSVSLQTHITPVPQNDAPVLTPFAGGGNYTEGTIGSRVYSAIDITDVDSSDFDGGALTFTIVANGETTDQLYVRDQGTAGGEVGVSGSNVTYNFGTGAVVVGSFTGGNGASDPFVVTFNANSDVTSVQAVARRVSFQNTSDDPSAAQRTIDVFVTDGDGGTSLTYPRTMDVVPVNDAPVAQNDPESPGYSALLAAQNPLSYWRLGESSGSTTNDSGSTGAAGTYMGGVLLNQQGALATEADAGVYFDGVDDYVEIMHHPDYLLAEGAVQLWFNADTSSGAYRTLFSKDAFGSASGGHLSVTLLNTGHLTVRLQSTSSSYVVSSANPITAGSWHHMAVNFGSGGMELYLDGDLIDTNAYAGGLDSASSGGATGNLNPVVIGAGIRNSGEGTSTPVGEFFAGSIDEVAIFNSRLSADVVADLYAGALQNFDVTEDGTLNVATKNGVLVNDYDLEGDALTAILNSGPANAASFILNGDGSFSYTPNPDFQGTDTFTYYVNDGTANSNIATATITVLAANDPGSVAITGSAQEYATLTANVSDIDGVSGSVAYQWRADGVDIAAATASSYTLTATEVGKAITVVATYTDDQGFNETVTSAPTSPVSNVNDTPTIADQSFTVAENSANGTVVGTLVASDPDVGDALTYSITGGNVGGAFAIDSVNGTITVADSAALDFETSSAFALTVQVKDKGVPILNNSATITINLNDLNEFAISAIADADTSANAVREDAIAGTAVGVTALASDADGSAVVSYSLDDDADGRFSIDSQSGVITVVGALDAATADSHTVVVRATSSDGSSTIETFSVAVVALSDTFVPPPPGDDPATDFPDNTEPPITLPDPADQTDDATSSEPATDEPELVTDEPIILDLRSSGTGSVDIVVEPATPVSVELAAEPIVQKTVIAVDQIRPQQNANQRLPGRSLDSFAVDEVLADHAIWAQLDQMKRDIEADDEAMSEQELIVKVVTGSTLTLSAGFVSWLLRGGTLIASLLSTLPVWKGFDPLPILSAKRRKEEDERKKQEQARKESSTSNHVEALFEADSQ